MGDIDEVSTLIQRVKLDSDVENEYKAAFQDIVRFVKEYRKHTITEQELEVTEALAAPFTQGGLLIILLEPRARHPWTLGVYSVIQDCRSLRVLEEGLKFVSQGLLSLTNGVSLLDLRPFLTKNCYPDLDSQIWERLYDIVYEAIKAKNPDALLCMGDEVIDAFDSRNGFLKACSLRHTQVIRAKHPGHFVNYNSQSPKKQQELLGSIHTAYNVLASKNSGSSRKIDILQGAISKTPTSLDSNDISISLINMRELQDCLDILMTLCFLSHHRLPTMNLEQGPFYFLQDWHRRWFKRCERATTRRIDRARALIFPIFLELNNCIRKVSWFDPTYLINRKRLSQIFKGFTTEWEQACYLLASGNEAEIATEFHEESGSERDLMDVRVSRIVSRAKHLWESRAHRPKRNALYVGPFVEDLGVTCMGQDKDGD